MARRDWVSVDRASIRRTMRSMDGIGRTSLEIVDDELDKMERTTRQLWPVDTGYSKGTISRLEQTRRDNLRTSIRVGAEYAFYVRIKALGNVNAAKRLLFDPALNLARRIAERMSREVR